MNGLLTSLVRSLQTWQTTAEQASEKTLEEGEEVLEQG